MDLEDLRRTVRLALQTGAPFYNADKVLRCLDIYLTSARTLLSLGKLQYEHKVILEDAIRKAEPLNECDAVWTLRSAFDVILADVEKRRQHQRLKRSGRAAMSIAPSPVQLKRSSSVRKTLLESAADNSPKPGQLYYGHTQW
eukprot:CAMPEP_0196663974 /NCGR_PEP_ID=MMETSP1086-20130531/55005_1 /TAXON_ID=77921 /ORGANISM="Cyanoptyche  gloeocystis , Strain SAG4.97" /LENGTH=141 /DNA_ID=CAMNT_0042000011 /DNA_START=70 /DNA_END=492 /DNA_ORIENTATION=+